MAGDGDRRNTWRTDRWAPCSRKEAGRWLTFLASLGYELSAIEQAVARGVPYEGEDTPAEPDAGGTGTPDTPPAGTDHAEAASAQAGSDPGPAEPDTNQPEPESDQADADSEQSSDSTGITNAGEAEAADETGEYPGAAVA